MTTATATRYTDIAIRRGEETEITFRGMAVGRVELVGKTFVFLPYVEFDEDEMDGVDADTMDELLDKIDNEVSQSYDLLEYRVSTG